MDIVERLRQEIGGYTDKDIEKAEADMKEAADEIERLRKDKAELLEEIKKLKEAKEINKYNSYPDDGFGGYPSVYNRR